MPRPRKNCPRKGGSKRSGRPSTFYLQRLAVHANLYAVANRHPLLLPQEIIIEVVRYLRDDKKSLISCSMVASGWLSASRVYLSEFRVHFLDLGHFYSAIKSSRRAFNSYARSLTLVDYSGLEYLNDGSNRDFSAEATAIWDAGSFKRSLARIPRLLPGVKRLCFENFSLESIPKRLRWDFLLDLSELKSWSLGHTGHRMETPWLTASRHSHCFRLSSLIRSPFQVIYPPKRRLPSVQSLNLRSSNHLYFSPNPLPHHPSFATFTGSR